MGKLSGLWTVYFESNFQTVGTGVAVFTENRILGGDSYYYYNGKVNFEGNILKADLNVVRFNKAGTAIFGNIDSFNLKVSGEISASNIELKGHMVEQPAMKITIRCKKIINA